jgi:hypothetical protein
MKETYLVVYFSDEGTRVEVHSKESIQAELDGWMLKEKVKFLDKIPENPFPLSGTEVLILKGNILIPEIIEVIKKMKI